jgi:hypothetical protein
MVSVKTRREGVRSKRVVEVAAGMRSVIEVVVPSFRCSGSDNSTSVAVMPAGWHSREQSGRQVTELLRSWRCC